MTHPIFSPSISTPTQRNRRLLLTLPACAVPLLSACGGGGDLTYDTEQALYMVGDAITPNKPQLSSSTSNMPASWKPTFFVDPALPAGLTLNSQTGVISGTPTKLKRQAVYTVKAHSIRGDAQTKLRITVTGRGTWSPAAALPGPRRYTTFTKLLDGKFLVAGGDSQGVATDSVQIYDPVSAIWRQAAPLLQARAEHQTVTLGDGRVLVCGGRLLLNDATATAEIYNPATNTWTATGNMNQSRAAASAHLLPNGKVLVLGGSVVPGLSYRNTAELFDATTGEWALQTELMSTPRGEHAAVLLPGGTSVLLVGGINSMNYVMSVEIYALGSSTHTVLTYAGYDGPHCAVLLDDGSVLLVSSGIDRVRRLDPVKLTWTDSSMGEPRLAPLMTLLADGRVLLTGGRDDKTAKIYNPDVNVWTTAAPMNTAGREQGFSALLGDGSVLVVGGITGQSQSYVETAERYIP